MREGVSHHLHHLADSPTVAVSRGDGYAVHTAIDQPSDMPDDPVAVDAAILVADRGDGSTAEQSEFRVAGRLECRTGFLSDSLDITECEQPLESILIVHDQQLVNSQIFGEEAIGACNRIRSEFALGNGAHLGPWRERLGDLAVGVAWLDHMPREESQQGSGGVDDRERAEAEALLVDELQNIADVLFGVDADGVLDESMDVVLYPRHFRELFLLSHVVVDEPESAVQRHGDGHARLGDGVHVGGHQRDVQVKSLGQAGVDLALLGEDLRVEGG